MCISISPTSDQHCRAICLLSLAVASAENNPCELQWRGAGPFTAEDLGHLLVFHIAALADALRAAFGTSKLHPATTDHDAAILATVRASFAGNGSIVITEGADVHVLFVGSDRSDVDWADAKDALCRQIIMCTKDISADNAQLPFKASAFRAAHKSMMRHVLIIIAMCTG